MGSGNTNRLDWHLTLIIQIYSGRDRQVRLIKIKTNNLEMLIGKTYSNNYSIRVQNDIGQNDRNSQNLEHLIEAVLQTREGCVIKKPICYY